MEQEQLAKKEQLAGDLTVVALEYGALLQGDLYGRVHLAGGCCKHHLMHHHL